MHPPSSLPPTRWHSLCWSRAHRWASKPRIHGGVHAEGGAVTGWLETIDCFHLTGRSLGVAEEALLLTFYLPAPVGSLNLCDWSSAASYVSCWQPWPHCCLHHIQYKVNSPAPYIMTHRCEKRAVPESAGASWINNRASSITP